MGSAVGETDRAADRHGLPDPQPPRGCRLAHRRLGGRERPTRVPTASALPAHRRRVHRSRAGDRGLPGCAVPRGPRPCARPLGARHDAASSSTIRRTGRARRRRPPSPAACATSAARSGWPTSSTRRSSASLVPPSRSGRSSPCSPPGRARSCRRSACSRSPPSSSRPRSWACRSSPWPPTRSTTRRGIVTTERDADGDEQTVYWRDYPGIAGLDPEEVLAGPTFEQGLADGEAMTAEIQDALTAEFGLDWAAPPSDETTVMIVENGFGGFSMLQLINAPTAQTTSVPRTWAEKQRAIAIIGEVTARYGFGAPSLDQEPLAADRRGPHPRLRRRDPRDAGAGVGRGRGSGRPVALLLLPGPRAGPHRSFHRSGRAERRARLAARVAQLRLQAPTDCSRRRTAPSSPSGCRRSRRLPATGVRRSPSEGRAPTGSGAPGPC